MGEARRRKLAGYVPGALAMIAAMLGDYPKLPNEVYRNQRS